MNLSKRAHFARQKTIEAKESLLNRISKQFGVPLPIRLVRPEAIIFGAQGCYEGEDIKVNRELPLFWQLIILEHEIGHHFALSGKMHAPKIIHAFHTHHLSTEEKRAWEWVDENPIVSGGIIDREVKNYIKQLTTIGKLYGHMDEVMRVGWWY